MGIQATTVRLLRACILGVGWGMVEYVLGRKKMDAAAKKKLDVCKRNMQWEELMDAMVKWEGDGLGNVDSESSVSGRDYVLTPGTLVLVSITHNNKAPYIPYLLMTSTRE